jgi:hypothetical protein
MLWGNLGPYDRAEESPFQMPARLADGLGLESGLGAVSIAPFAPSRSLCSGEFGSPAPGFRKEAELRLLRRQTFVASSLENPDRFTT